MDKLIGAVLAAIALAAGMAVWQPWVQSATVQPAQNEAASHIAQVASAVNNLVSNNYQTYVTNSAGGPVAITIANLQAPPGNYLPNTFVDTNPFGQTTAAIVYQPSAGFLKVLVANFGGQAIPDTTLARLSAMADTPNVFNASGAGGRGGAIFNASPTFATTATGDQKEPLANYAVSGYTLAPGHLAVLLYYDGTSAIPSSLQRFACPGQPTCNQMFTTLNLGTNDITNIGNATASGNIMSTGGYLQGTEVIPSTVVAQGAACSPAGAIGQSATGAPLYCNTGTGVWTVPPAQANFVIWY